MISKSPFAFSFNTKLCGRSVVFVVFLTFGRSNKSCSGNHLNFLSTFQVFFTFLSFIKYQDGLAKVCVNTVKNYCCAPFF